MEDRKQFIRNLITEETQREDIKRALISHGYGTEGFDAEYAALLQEMGKTEPAPVQTVGTPVRNAAEAEAHAVALPSVSEMLGYGLSVTKMRWKAVSILAGLSMVPNVLVFFSGYIPPYAFFIMVFAGIGISILATSALLYLTIQNDDTIEVSDALHWSLRYFFPIVWIGLLGTLIVATGLVLLVVPALIFTVYNVFSFISLVKEDARGTNAIVRSADLVRGAFFPILGRMILIMLIFFGVGLLLGGGLALLSVSPILKEIGNIVGTGFEMIVTAISIGAFVKLYEARVTVRPLFDRSSYRGLVWLFRIMALLGVVVTALLLLFVVRMSATFYEGLPQDEPIQWGQPPTIQQGEDGFNFEDFVTQSNIEATAASANIYHGRMGSYEGVCNDIPVVDPIQCRQGGEAFIVFAPLSTGELYCSDSTSFSGLITSLDTAQTSCQ